MSKHIPVLLKETIDALDIKSDGIYVDLTLGRTGHSQEILKKLSTGKLISFDKDIQAINESDPILKKLNKNFIFILIHSDYSNLKNELDKIGINSVDGIIGDLGVSSPQLDEAHRGFSFTKDAKLDMRMNQNQTLDADEIVNKWSEEELIKIFRDYADVKPARQVAKGIIANRPIHSTIKLSRIVNDSLPAKLTSLKNYPKVVFQAIRIAVNDELNSLNVMVNDAISLLNKDGSIAIITFHSLEDRIVKKVFGLLTKDFTGKLPIFVEKKYKVKTIKPSKAEMEINKRSRSAKLRVLKKL